LVAFATSKQTPLFFPLKAKTDFSDLKSEAFSIDPKNIGDSVRSRDSSTGTCFDTPLFWLEKTFNYILSRERKDYFNNIFTREDDGLLELEQDDVMALYRTLHHPHHSSD
jgi:hypothetical protein